MSSYIKMSSDKIKVLEVCILTGISIDKFYRLDDKERLDLYIKYKNIKRDIVKNNFS